MKQRTIRYYWTVLGLTVLLMAGLPLRAVAQGGKKCKTQQQETMEEVLGNRLDTYQLDLASGKDVSNFEFIPLPTQLVLRNQILSEYKEYAASKMKNAGKDDQALACGMQGLLTARGKAQRLGFKDMDADLADDMNDVLSHYKKAAQRAHQRCIANNSPEEAVNILTFQAKFQAWGGEEDYEFKEMYDDCKEKTKGKPDPQPAKDISCKETPCDDERNETPAAQPFGPGSTRSAALGETPEWKFYLGGFAFAGVFGFGMTGFFRRWS